MFRRHRDDRVGAVEPSLLDARAGQPATQPADPYRVKAMTRLRAECARDRRRPHERFDGWAPVRSGHSYRVNAVAGRTPAALPDEASRDERPQLCLSKWRALHAAAPALDPAISGADPAWAAYAFAVSSRWPLLSGCSSQLTTREVAAPSRVEQSAELASGPSQVVLSGQQINRRCGARS